MSDNIIRISAHIQNKFPLSKDVFSVQLRVPASQSFNFRAGQYLLLVLNDEDKRPFSIASTPAELPNIYLHIRSIDNNPFTEQILQKLTESEYIDIEGPFGNCQLSGKSPNPVVFIVGGTGFAPAKSMLEQFLEKYPDNQFSLYWGARTAEELYHADLPLLWVNQYINFDYHPVISDPDPLWSGAKGLVHQYAFQHLTSLLDTDFYLAGSIDMVKAIYLDLLKEGVSKENIHSDMLDILRAQGELI
ncbi:MAG: hypothetical protein COW84_05845 [Gammaproteobacteria bacterium CG22_combo_CG10-13_8_21_14_all_40_8]|nr:MAG: hypothetical protein COW84_05845 [Gammaproteobacteria bacterium CG22_combo_CG10-13_8_21_14_all_40_8]